MVGTVNEKVQQAPGREGKNLAGMRIYLSYARPDKNFALSLARQLAAQGHRVWMDLLALLPGDNWPLEIGKALQDCDAMLVLLSPNSAASEGQRHEIDYALSSDQYAGRVIPVFVRPTKDYPWILDKFTAVHASNNPAAAGRKIGQLLRKVS
jgi:hypothetical protein